MIICICNNLNEKDFDKLTEDEYNEIVKCGKCRECVKGCFCER